jgi:hypothetical protein
MRRGESTSLARLSLSGSPMNQLNVLENAFLLVGMEYYITARSAALANLINVYGNLYHHAIEMLLKAVLSRRYSVDQLRSKKLGHNLPILWDRFKAEFSSIGLQDFDELIRDLHRFETIRYPDKLSEQGGLLFIEWGTSSQDSLPGFLTYKINATNIDHLVVKLFDVSSTDLATCMYTLKSNLHVREILTRYNPVAAQLLPPEAS